MSDVSKFVFDSFKILSILNNALFMFETWFARIS